MSYAAVAGHNVPPTSQQPQPDPALLNRQSPTTDIVDETAKVNVAPPDFKRNPHTITSETSVAPQYSPTSTDSSEHSRKGKIKKQLHKAEEEGSHLWSRLERQLLRPGVAGGLIGIANVGLIASAGYAFYSKPHYRTDSKIISSAVGVALLILGSEGILAEAYGQTEQGRVEAQRAREEGDYLYRRTREIVLRPGILGGIVGAFNVAVLGTVGYFAYQSWDLPRWDRRMVSAVTVGLLGLSVGEGYLGEQYREKEYPKRK